MRDSAPQDIFMGGKGDMISLKRIEYLANAHGFSSVHTISLLVIIVVGFTLALLGIRSLLH